MMRSVSFVDRLELDFSGNHFSHALALGDVDSDGVSTKMTRLLFPASMHLSHIRVGRKADRFFQTSCDAPVPCCQFKNCLQQFIFRPFS